MSVLRAPSPTHDTRARAHPEYGRGSSEPSKPRASQIVGAQLLETGFGLPRGGGGGEVVGGCDVSAGKITSSELIR